MRVVIGSDAEGMSLKNIIKDALVEDGHEVVDLSVEPAADFVDSALAVAADVQANDGTLGFCFDGYGVGSYMVCTRVKGIVCANISDERSAYMTREHNNSRIVCMGPNVVDESSPMVDARLPGGERVNVIIPPLALDGPTITIRRFPEPFRLPDLVARRSLPQEAADLLGALVAARFNILVSGGTGSGKTTFLNALSGTIPDRERIVTIEDAAELSLQQPHVVRLEARPANTEGRGQVTIRDLVRNSLRMRPDRIIVGEVRGGETLDMLQAMNTGHEGSLTTVHANSAIDALSRLETLSSMSDVTLPVETVRDQINGAIDIIIQLERDATGARRVSTIEALTSRRREAYTTTPLLRYRHAMRRSSQGTFEFRGIPEPMAQRVLRHGQLLPDSLKVIGAAS